MHAKGQGVIKASSHCHLDFIAWHQTACAQLTTTQMEPVNMKRDALPVLTPTGHDDEDHNFSLNPTFDSVLAARLSRRRALLGGMQATALAVLGSASLAACGGDDDDPAPAPPPTGGNPTPTPTPAPEGVSLKFDTVAKSVADALSVPAGYTASVLYRLGDPIAAGIEAYKNDGTDTAATYDKRAGDHHDGMHYFGMNANGAYDTTSSNRALLVMNHEAITPDFLHPNGVSSTGSGANEVRTVADEVLKEFYTHGVSVVEINRDAAGKWSYKQDGSLNRRVHTLTDMVLSGPAGKTAYMVTKYAPDGSKTRGTVNNCANGYTPWGTYLTCEENWAGYAMESAAMAASYGPLSRQTRQTIYMAAGMRNNWAPPPMAVTITVTLPTHMAGWWRSTRLHLLLHLRSARR
jgi:uncharacterized protein